MAQSLGLSNVPHNHNLQSNSSAFFRYSSAFWMACITTTWLLDLWSHLYTELIDFCLHFYKPTSDIPASCYTNLTSFNSLLLTQTELYAISVNNYVSASGLHRNYFLSITTRCLDGLATERCLGPWVLNGPAGYRTVVDPVTYQSYALPVRQEY